MTISPERFQKVAVEPDRCIAKVYISNPAFDPIVHSGRSLPATMADRVKALVGFSQQLWFVDK